MYRMKRREVVDDRSQEYTSYIITHVSNVIRSWEDILRPAIMEHLDELSDVIDTKGISRVDNIIKSHDSSKWQSDEWFAYLDHWYPEKGQPDNDDAYDLAWLHHQQNNGHHWQHWILIRDSGNTYPLDMPIEYICEMICDWHSFSAKADNNTAKDWYEIHGDDMILSRNARMKLEQLLEFADTPLTQLD